jgi:hypothetical protein
MHRRHTLAERVALFVWKPARNIPPEGSGEWAVRQARNLLVAAGVLVLLIGAITVLAQVVVKLVSP